MFQPAGVFTIVRSAGFGTKSNSKTYMAKRRIKLSTRWISALTLAILRRKFKLTTVRLVLLILLWRIVRSCSPRKSFIAFHVLGARKTFQERTITIPRILLLVSTLGTYPWLLDTILGDREIASYNCDRTIHKQRSWEIKSSASCSNMISNEFINWKTYIRFGIIVQFPSLRWTISVLSIIYLRDRF